MLFMVSSTSPRMIPSPGRKLLFLSLIHIYQFETAFLITDNVGEEMDYRQYAARFMQMNQVGYGESNEGLCVFHQPDARNITIVSVSYTHLCWAGWRLPGKERPWHC